MAAPVLANHVAVSLLAGFFLTRLGNEIASSRQ